MRLFENKQSAGCDDIPERIHRRLHTIYFILFCVMAAAVFLMFWNTLCNIFLDAPKPDDEDSPFLMHQYCGTFFVEINEENSFDSKADYDAYVAKYWSEPQEEVKQDTAQKSKAGDILNAVFSLVLLAFIIVRFFMNKTLKIFKNTYLSFAVVFLLALILSGRFDISTPMSMVLVLSLVLALRSGDKKTIFSNKSSEYFFTCGAVWLAGNIILAITYKPQTDFMTGIFSRPVFYVQLYNLLGLPFIALCMGLMIRRHELKLANADTAKNTLAIKLTCGTALAAAAGFILCRLTVRIIELVKTLTDSSYSVKLPFTLMEDFADSKLIELPRELAKSDSAYNSVVVYRFVKDIPVFVICAAAVVYFLRVMMNISKGELNTRRNRRMLNAAMVLLLTASLWFNLMGLHEVGLFNNGFTGIYGEVVYTIALRSMTEPALYAAALWFFKTYLQAVPEVTSDS